MTILQSLSCKNCKGLCCGPVPVTKQELHNIKKEIKRRSYQYRSQLENQHRYFGTCIFYDLEIDKCGIYSARPSICKAFGYYNNLICFRNPEASSAKNWEVTEKTIGILSVDFTWRDFK